MCCDVGHPLWPKEGSKSRCLEEMKILKILKILCPPYNFNWRAVNKQMTCEHAVQAVHLFINCPEAEIVWLTWHFHVMILILLLMIHPFIHLSIHATIVWEFITCIYLHFCLLWLNFIDQIILASGQLINKLPLSVQCEQVICLLTALRLKLSGQCEIFMLWYSFYYLWFICSSIHPCYNILRICYM